jgi:adenylosuccinate lyase
MTDLIERYSLPEMRHIWSPGFKFRVWAAVAARQAQAKSNDPDLLAALVAYPIPTVDQVADLESVTRHDVAAFLRAWREPMKEQHAQQVHTGLTSSDLVDTANAVIMSQASDYIVKKLETLLVELAKAALKYWDVPRLGRTHGQPAEPTTLGYQLAKYTSAMVINASRFTDVLEDIEIVKMSGPVGAYRETTVAQEQILAKLIGGSFEAAQVAGQRLGREGYARWVSELAICASTVEDLALQFRLGQQFGIEEIAESFGHGQVGSSSMPHKQNPIRAENLCGLARLVRAQVMPVMEGIPTWGERDITHSSVERMALPTAATLTHFMIAGATALVSNMTVDRVQIDKNLRAARCRPNSAHYKTLLVQSGLVTHEDADYLVAETIDTGQVRRLLGQYGLDELAELPPARLDHVRELMEEVVRGH